VTPIVGQLREAAVAPALGAGLFREKIGVQFLRYE
jgi:hypothetical protein